MRESMSAKRIGTAGKTGLILALCLCASACSTPSQKYGLAPVSQTPEAYPNINQDPAQKSAEATMTPQQRAEAEAELMREAGKLPKR
jgi:hypothetical protein